MRLPSTILAALLFFAPTMAIAAPATTSGNALIDAVEAHNVGSVHDLLAGGADPNVRDKWGHETPLIDAISNRDGAIATLLLQHHADPNYANIDGKTPLMAAAGVGDIELVRQLLHCGANVNAVENNRLPPELAHDPRGKTVLMWGTDSGNLDVVHLLLSAGAPVDARDAEGQSALIEACGIRQKPMVNLLLQHGARFDRNRDSYPALSTAIRANDIPTSLKLLSLGLDPNTHDEVGFTPLMDAAIQNNDAVASALIHHGAHVDARDHGGDSALMLAAYHGAVGVIRLLHQHGAGVDARNDRGETALITAAQEDQPKSITCLVQLGAKVDGVDKAGATALFHAALQGHPHCVRTLLDLGADPNTSTTFGMSVLAAAAEGEGGGDIVQMLIDKGAKVDAPDHDGVNPLMRARNRGKADVVKLLETHGAK